MIPPTISKAAACFLSCSFIIFGVCGSTSAAPLFEVTILPFATPGGLNNAGQVAGHDASNTSAFLWLDGVNTPLATMPAAFPAYASQQGIFATHISENGIVGGQISGALPQGGRDTRAVTFDGLATDLGALPGSTSFTGGQSANLTAINNSGTAVGTCTDSSGTTRPVIWSGGSVAPIGTAAGSAIDINNAGQIVGAFGVQGFLATAGSPANLLALPGHVQAMPLAINQAGFIVGRSRQATDFNAPETAVMWNNGGAPVDHGHLPGADLTFPVDLNQSLEVVGRFRMAGELTFSGYYRDTTGTYYKLNDVLDPSDPDSDGIDIALTKSINDNGWILARGTKVGLGTVGLLLKPVAPIPVLPIATTIFVPAVGGGSASFEIAVVSKVGSEYQLERSTDGQGSFEPVGSPVDGTGALLALTDSAAPSGTAIYLVKENTPTP